MKLYDIHILEGHLLEDGEHFVADVLDVFEKHTPSTLFKHIEELVPHTLIDEDLLETMMEAGHDMVQIIHTDGPLGVVIVIVRSDDMDLVSGASSKKLH